MHNAFPIPPQWPNQPFHHQGCQGCSLALNTGRVCPLHCTHPKGFDEHGACNDCAVVKPVYRLTYEDEVVGENHATASAKAPYCPVIIVPASNNAYGHNGTMHFGCVFSSCAMCTRTAASERKQGAIDEAKKQAAEEDTRTLAGVCASFLESSKAVMETVYAATMELYKPESNEFNEIKLGVHSKVSVTSLLETFQRQLGTLGVDGVSDLSDAIKKLRDAKCIGLYGRVNDHYTELRNALAKVLDLVYEMSKPKKPKKTIFMKNLNTMRTHLESLSTVLSSAQDCAVPKEKSAPERQEPPPKPQPPGKRHYDFVDILLIELAGKGVDAQQIQALYAELDRAGLETLNKLCEERRECMDAVVEKLWGIANRIGDDPFSETWNRELAPYTTCDGPICKQRYESVVGHHMNLDQTLDRLKAHVFLFTFMAWWHTRNDNDGSQAGRMQMSQRLQWVLGTLYIRSAFYYIRLKRTALASVSMAVSTPFHDKLSSMLGKDQSVANWAASCTREWTPAILKAHFSTYFQPVFDQLATLGSLHCLSTAVYDAIKKFDEEHGSALHDVMIVMAKMLEVQGVCTNVQSSVNDREGAKKELCTMINAALEEMDVATFNKKDMPFKFVDVHCKPTFESVAHEITFGTVDATARHDMVYDTPTQKSANDLTFENCETFFNKVEFAFERFNYSCSNDSEHVASSALFSYATKTSYGKAPVYPLPLAMPPLAARASVFRKPNACVALVRVMLKQMKTDLVPIIQLEIDADDPTLGRMSPTKRMCLPDVLSELFMNTTPLEGGREYVKDVVEKLRRLEATDDMSKFEEVAETLLTDPMNATDPTLLAKNATLLAYMCVDIYSKPPKDGFQRPSLDSVSRSRDYKMFHTKFKSLNTTRSQTVATGGRLCLSAPSSQAIGASRWHGRAGAVEKPLVQSGGWDLKRVGRKE